MIVTRALSARALSGVAALALSVGGAVGVFVATAGPAAADTITVTNTADDGSGTSLRGVLENANAGDVVVLTPGATYQLTICDPPEIKSAEGSFGWGDVEINAAVTIEGNGATLEQTCSDRVLYTQDEITLHNVTITGGDVEGPGGGLFEDSDNPITLNGVTFTHNAAGDGGGVATFGDVSVSGSSFTDNHANAGGGDGGGIKVFSAVATVTIDGSTFSGNTANGWGGAFEQEGNQIESTATGVFELTVTNSSIVDNVADSDGAGGIDTEDDSTMTIDHSTLSGNEGGGAGAVGNFASSDFSANASTFSGNTSHASGSALLGGGSYSVVNSTITGNTESAFGAINVEAVTLLHVMMTNNTSLGETAPTSLSDRGLGALAAEVQDAANISTNSLTSADSVVAQPHGAVNCSVGETNTMSAAAIPSTDGGYNFSDDTSCGFTAPTSNVKTPNDPGLGPLANNGGPTMTLLPQVGSPLLDAIPPAACGAPVDQRGVTRPQGSGCDIGAVEVEVLAPTPAPAAVVVTPKFTG